MRELQGNELKYYFLNTYKLQPGDVILERGTGIHSEMIVKKTKGNFSHAMIYVGGTIIEATVQGGVYSRVPNRVYVHDLEHLLVLRPKKNLTSKETQDLCTYARNLSGSAYSIREAIIAGSNHKPEYTLTRSQFCSRLVAQAYAKIGVNISQNIDYCSPADIEKSTFFNKLNGMVHQGQQDEIDFVNKGGTHADHAKRAVKWVRKAKKILFKNNIHTIICPQTSAQIKISTINDIYFAVLQNEDKSEIDKEIASAMLELGYNLAPFDDQKYNPYRYSYSNFCEVYRSIRPQEALNCINKEFKRDARELMHRVDNFVQSYSTFKQHKNMNVFRVDFEINLNMIKKLKSRLDILIEYAKEQVIPIPLSIEEFERYASLESLIIVGDDSLN